MRIIASCSTLPTRLDQLQKAVNSVLREQRIEKVFIHYPYESKRLHLLYPEPPEWMLHHPRVIIHRTDDHGPMTKFAPMFDIVAPDAEVGLLLFYDDNIYPEGWFQPLLAHFDGHSALGLHGSMNRQWPFLYSQWNTSKQPYLVCNLSTSWGVIYPRTSLPETTKDAVQFVAKYKDLRNNDDMALASWCYQSKTPLRMLPVGDQMINIWNLANPHVIDPNSLAVTPEMQKMRQIRLAHQMIQDGVYPIPWAEMTLFVFALTLVFLFIMLIMIAFARS